MEIILNLSILWLIVIFCALTSFIFIILYVCWRKQKKCKHSDSFYSYDIKQTYSSIKGTNDLAEELVPKDSVHFGISNLFRSIQSNKYKNAENNVFNKDLEALNTETMLKKFDKTKLRLNWNEVSDNESTETLTIIDKDDAASCISADSKATFKSAVTYNRCYSIADTFKSVNSDN